MSQYTAYRSDITGDEIDGDPISVDIFVDRVCDAAGAMDNVYEHFDMDVSEAQTLIRSLAQHPVASKILLEKLHGMQEHARKRS